jgi:CubicO group peptidase (beta-lactamase class C family)
MSLRISRLLLLVLSVSTLTFAAADTSKNIRQLIEQQVANGFTGAVFVQSKGKTLVDNAFGASKHSSFWIASAGKQFTATAILKCEQNGLLKLSDPISKFFLQAPADKRNITVEQLLAHTSGFDQSYVSEILHDRDEAVRRMLAEPLIDTPGNKFHYSNSNYQMAVAIVEVATKTDYRSYMRRLWSQAGLRNTRHPPQSCRNRSFAAASAGRSERCSSSNPSSERRPRAPSPLARQPTEVFSSRHILLRTSAHGA